mmetsp:Transcript_44668/g.69907  ORF Transcript_44668/g.69907 Transcript_44668/m.69907 type:complete len:90 (-) Transcript_44668:848-1117(-)
MVKDSVGHQLCKQGWSQQLADHLLVAELTRQGRVTLTRLEDFSNGRPVHVLCSPTKSCETKNEEVMARILRSVGTVRSAHWIVATFGRF